MEDELQKLIAKIVMKLSLIILASWYFLDRFHIVAVSTNLPIGNITVFLGGVFLIVLYLMKEEMPVAFFWTAPAGEYKQPRRLLGLAFGLFLVVWMIVYHFKGVKL
jgi:hypothetical protein